METPPPENRSQTPGAEALLDLATDVIRQKNTYIELLQDVAVAVNQSLCVEEAIKVCLEKICRHMDWCIGQAYFLQGENGGTFESTPLWHLDSERFGHLRRFIESNRVQLGTGLPSRVVASGKLEWTNDVCGDAEFVRRGDARAAGLTSALALPILVGKTVVAVLEVFSDKPVVVDEPFLEVMANVGVQLGRAFERARAEEAQRQFSVDLLRAQDHDRRRVARELHDSAGQYLAATSMCLSSARERAKGLSPEVDQKLDEAASMITRCESEIRTISYLLHPPLLEELGLVSAARWCVEGFAQRSGIRVQVEITDTVGRLDSEVELVLFRVLQESLTNIHRHSGSKVAGVRIGADSGRVWLEVSDRGKGMPNEPLEPFARSKSRPGVGITGMRERVKDLAGVLEITSDQSGTRVKAVIPLASEPHNIKVDRKKLSAAS